MRDHGTHRFGNITRKKVDAILDALSAHGSKISGGNPWNVDTGKHGVKLLGEWSEETQTLAITVTDADWYVPGKAVWETIDALMREVEKEG